ncbi:hypothetical protein ACPUYX_20495, partial [Desulfosporosinus sp. SYSU MS00001]|uniref:hypothetical protein n=1 Tax=Desulfosporosinus sp. SYSU MS00001 TaxID=3416284 RepID=UPI003CEA5299
MRLVKHSPAMWIRTGGTPVGIFHFLHETQIDCHIWQSIACYLAMTYFPRGYAPSIIGPGGLNF